MRQSHNPEDGHRQTHVLRQKFNVINEALIRESLDRLKESTEDLEERRADEPQPEGLDGVDVEAVKKLQFSFKNLYLVSSLEGFTNLEVLLLDNNAIADVGGLDHLRNLRRLDLSFNSIETILPTSFDGLDQLENLSLFANRISSILTLQPLPNLRCLNVGRNLLDTKDDVDHLRQFKRLRSLVMADNPIHRHRTYQSIVLEHLPTLTFLDHRLVRQEDIDDARDRSDNYNRLEEDQLQEQRRLKRLAEEEAQRRLLDDANIPSIGDLFDCLFEKYPKDLEDFNFFTAVCREEYQKEYLNIIRSFVETMTERMHDKRAELEELRAVIEEEKTKNMLLSRSLIKHFERRKKQVYRRLRVAPRFSHEEEPDLLMESEILEEGEMASASGASGAGDPGEEMEVVVDEDGLRRATVSKRFGILMLENLEVHAKSLIDKLIEIEVNQSEAFVDVCEQFVENYRGLDGSEIIASYFKDLMLEDKKFSAEFATVIKELIPLRDKIDSVKDPDRREKLHAVKHLLEDKDQIEAVMRRAAESRQEVINAREEQYQTIEKQRLDDVIQMVRNEEHERNRMRIYEIWSYYDRMAGKSDGGQREPGEIQEMRAKFESRFD